MRTGVLTRLGLALVTSLTLGCAGKTGSRTEARIIKVLPCLLDAEGRASLHPSLYERDAYQALLRRESGRVGGLRFDILWRASRVVGAPSLVLKLEMRGSSRDPGSKAGDVVEVVRPVPASYAGRSWSQVVLGPDEFRRVGEVSAWKATLLRGEEVVASSQSFLW